MGVHPKYKRAFNARLRDSIRHRMLDLRLSRQDLADMTGLSVATTTRLLNPDAPDVDMKISTLLAIAEAVGLMVQIDLHENHQDAGKHRTRSDHRGAGDATK